ncbi:MAG: pyridoxamine 5'-phosphate oxidase family protein [Paludibacter sp.]|nr:pyridoxamine 5'-phosphate oxidase family protein [Paludibacter sp.]
MNKLPEIVSEAWKTRKGPIVFSTVNKQGNPNSIYATCVSLFNDEKILVANNFFSKTFENISSGSTGSILFLTAEDKSYQIKGTISYFTEGELFDDMKKWNSTRLPGHGVAVIEIQEVYAGAQKII